MQVGFDLANRNPALRPAGCTTSVTGFAAASGNTQRMQQTGRQDKVEVSKQGKVYSALESLMKQKDYLTECKSKLITETLESGKELKMIKPELEQYEEQLKFIDEQISSLMLQEAQKAVEGDEKKSSKKEEMTAEEAQKVQMHQFAGVETSLDQTQKVSAIKNSVAGEQRIIKAQIKADELQIEHFKDKIRGLDSDSAMAQSVESIISHAQKNVRLKKDSAEELNAKELELTATEADLNSVTLEQTEETSEQLSKSENAQDAGKETSQGQQEAAQSEQ